MNIKPVAGPMTNTTIGQSSSAQAARERAISRLVQAPAPVQNQNQVSPEELPAVKEPVQETKSEQIQQFTEVNTEKQHEIKEEKPNPLESQYHALARREKQLRAKVLQQEQALKAKEQALLEREQALKSKDQEYSSYIQRDYLKKNPLVALAEAGISYDELTAQILNQQPVNPQVEATINQLQSKIDQLTKALETQEKTQQTQQQEAYQSALLQIKRDATQLVNSDPSYELTRNTGEVDQIVELIERTYKEEGYVMDIEEAASLVEQELESRLDKVYTRTEKLKKKYSQPQTIAKPATEKPAQPPAQPQQPQMKTLTNAASSTRKLSSRERAILAFKGELK